MAADLITIATKLKPLATLSFNAARSQWRRRGADAIAPFDPATIDRYLTEAFDLLQGEAQQAETAAKIWAKAKLAGRPAQFDESNVKDWLRLPEVRALLNDAARKLIAGLPHEEQREQAIKQYARIESDSAWYGEPLFELAISFAALSLDARMDAGDHIVADIVKTTQAQITLSIKDTEEKILDRLNELDPKMVSGSDVFPSDLVAEHIIKAVRREERLRTLFDPKRLDRILALANKVRDGDWQRAPASARIEIFRAAAATLARSKRTEEADSWLDAAEAAGANDLAPDRARVVLHSGDPTAAITLLHGREEPVPVSLTLEAIAARDGAPAALDAMRKHLSADKLSGFGLASVASWMEQAGDWTGAEVLFAAATPEQIDENPVLLLLRARFRFAGMLSAGQRSIILENIGTFPSPNMLRTDTIGERLRQQALSDLAALAIQADLLNDEPLRDLVDVHRIFLEVTAGDERIREAAKSQLANRLSDPASGVEYATLCFTLDVGFDKAVLRAKLDRAQALGGWSSAELLVATQLVMRDGDEEQILAFVDKHRDRLAAEVVPELAFGLEVEVLAKKGRIDDARARLAAIEDRLDPTAVTRLTNIIAEEDGADGVALRLATYEQSRSEQDLHFLVATLAERNDPRTGDYAAALWRMRPREQDAILACDAYSQARADTELDAFLAELGPLVAGHWRLEEHLAWSHYRNGQLDKAQFLVERLRLAEPDRSSLRQLEINVGLDNGDWHRLGPLFRSDLARSDQRTARDLLQAASLAATISDPLAFRLAKAAVSRSPDDPNVLMAAYQLAVRLGVEELPEAGEWLHAAAERSGADGPIQKRPIRDLFDMRLQEQERIADIDRKLKAGNVPLAMAVRLLNTTLSELILGRLGSDHCPSDPRQRLCLPLIAGNRLSWDISGFDRVALDPTAILALEQVELLDEALEAFPKIVLPNGTFPLLLHDIDHSMRGQPSVVLQAHRIRRLIDDGRITAFNEGPADSTDEGYARAVALDGLLVHAAPLYEPGSLMEQERDPAPFADRMVSPQSLVQALTQIGELRRDEAERAITTLDMSGPIWPSEPEIDLARPLVIDLGALHILDSAGILIRLVHAGPPLHISDRAVEILDQTIAGARTARDLKRSIERVASTLKAALARDSVTIGPMRRSPRQADDERIEGLDEAIELQPLLSLLRPNSPVDLLVSGERMINQQGRMTDAGGGERPIATPLDVVEHLFRTGRIDAGRLASAKRKLREGSVGLMPLTAEELVAAAAEGDWSRGPSRTLEAICQAIQLALLRRAITFPVDQHWLSQLPFQFTQAIHRCWAELPTLEAARAAADYLLLNLPDIEGYAVIAGGDMVGPALFDQTIVGYMRLALPLTMPQDRLDAYQAWHEARVEPRLFGRDSRAVPVIAQRLADLLVSREAIKTKKGKTLVEAPDVAKYFARMLPVSYQKILLRRPEVRAALKLDAVAFRVAGIAVAPEALGRFLTAAIAGEDASLTGINGSVIEGSGGLNAEGDVVLRRSEETLGFSEGKLFAAEPAIRIGAFDQLAAGRTLAPARERRWRSELAAAVPADDILVALNQTFSLAPEAFVENLLNRGSELTFEELSPPDREYYEGLLDLEDLVDELAALIPALASAFLDLPRPREKLLAIAPLAVAEGFRLEPLTADLPDPELAELALQLRDAGDPFSAVAGFELASARLASDECRAVANSILDLLLGEEGELAAMAAGFCVAGLATMHNLDVRRTLVDWPLSTRRYAALVHAGHATRALRRLGIDGNAAFAQAERWAGFDYLLVGMVERHEDGHWLREWFRPACVAAHVLMRLGVAVGKLDQDQVPPDWLERVMNISAPALHPNPFVMLPGPLGAFDPAAFEWPPIAVGEFESAVQSRDFEKLATLAFLSIIRVPLTDDQQEFVEALIRPLDDPGIDVERRDTLAEALLRVAARRRMPGLAERIWEHFWRSREAQDYGPGALVLVALAVGASRAAPTDRVTRSRELLDLIAATLPPAQLKELAVVLEKLAAIPGWAPPARNALIVALLGMQAR